jgi:hypothetical protein
MPVAHQSVLERHALQAALMTMLLEVPPAEALGAAVSILLNAADKHPEMLRRVLASSVEKYGVRQTIRDVLIRT